MPSLTPSGQSPRQLATLPPPLYLLKTPPCRPKNSIEMVNLLQDFLGRYKAEQPTQPCLQTIHRDLAELQADPSPGVFVAPEENDMTVVHAVIIGSWDTPLEGGLFHLVLKCPHDCTK
ncbi:hypothetical protein HPB51_010272 [Rhipicephalus microplus]|uniref:UBC core domain-containing protein n=1 Tax=Rhipicephalus microplus TaxID=6941 RepID=A0A9J6D4Y0_RHIMP|nr:hypothetical protein HPB51_010272 [Rhipicephalus microplus]